MTTTREEGVTAMLARLRQVGRASAYLALGAATGVLAWVIAAGIAVAIVLVPLLVGLPLLPWAVRGLRRLSGLDGGAPRGCSARRSRHGTSRWRGRSGSSSGAPSTTRPPTGTRPGWCCKAPPASWWASGSSGCC